MKVVVIGAGVIGASVAFRLMEAGVLVTVLDAGRVGGGTSGCSFAWTNSHRGDAPPEYHALRVASMALFPELKSRFRDAEWFHPSGNLEWGRPGLEENVARLQARGYRAEWIDRHRLLELEPGIDPACVGNAPIAWYPDDGWLDPVAYAGDLLRAAQALGAVLRTGAQVVAIQSAGGRVTGVRLADGGRIGCDAVVNCAGRWSAEVSEAPVFRVPLAPTIGFLVFTPPVASGLQRPVHPPGVNLRPDGAGRLMVQSTDVEPTVGPDAELHPVMPQALEVMRRGAVAVPALRGVEAEAVRRAVRPIPADELPAVGPAPRLEGYYIVVTHSGVTLSPLLGLLVADEVARGNERAELAPFRPGRFLKS
jgi:glycine/D-amino acid oxidase-like deaminating enzyme